MQKCMKSFGERFQQALKMSHASLWERNKEKNVNHSKIYSQSYKSQHINHMTDIEYYDLCRMAG